MDKVIENFNVRYLGILDESGKVDEKLMPSLKSDTIKRMYELMVLTRAFDDKANKLQRQGRLGTYASVRGQEASQIASAIQMNDEDFAVPAFREHGLYLTRGVDPVALFMYWGGDERGSSVKQNILPVSIPVGTHPLHATGIAMAFNYLKKKNVALTYFSDGATSEGDFHEAMNFAGVFKAPVVFICQNNQWAISTPVGEQTASKTLAQKAIAYGFEGIRVDGNDVFAVYKATFDAIKKARAGKGPTLIECLTYRVGDHTTSDDASKYRKESEVKIWEKKDPIIRLRKYMQLNGIGNEDYFNLITKNSEKAISDAVEKFETSNKYPAEEIFDYTFASLTDDLKEQKAEFKEDMKGVK
jgi:pyruvate dehydrogenase E1 component alpha subunit